VVVYGCSFTPPPAPPPLQPENLLLESKVPGSKVKLADFGLAVECDKNHKEYFGERKEGKEGKREMVMRGRKEGSERGMVTCCCTRLCGNCH